MPQTSANSTRISQVCINVELYATKKGKLDSECKDRAAWPKQKASKIIFAAELLINKFRESINPTGREIMQNGSPSPNL